MVLENASGPSPQTSFDDGGVPQSDRDPYATGSAPDPNATKVDASNWPKPAPLFGRLLGFSPEVLQKRLQRQVITSTGVLGRPLNQEEVEALGYWTAKSMSIQSYGPPLGIAAGAYRARATKATYKFPFFTPDMQRLDVNFFPSARIKWLTGIKAQSAWHSLRSSAYLAVGYFVGSVLFSSYAASVGAVGEMSDSRLKPLMEALSNRAKNQYEKINREAGRQTSSQNSAQRPGEAKVWKGQSRNVDDASPTGGYGLNDSSLPVDSERMLTDEEIRAMNEGAGAKVAPSTPSAYQARRTAPQSNTNSFGDSFDDASPTGGRNAETPQSSGSAWDRIRQQQTTGAPPNSQRPNAWSRVQNGAQKQEGSAPTDDFGFSSQERDR